MYLLRALLFPTLHDGVKMVSWASAIRWFGWGFAEAFIPVFLFSFTHSYTGAAALTAVFGIVFLLSLPVIGVIANTVRSKKIIIAGLVLYPFVSIGYFLAGFFGTVVALFVARMVNGLSYALVSVGRLTYIRKHAKKERLGFAFGYFETIANLLWISAVLGSIFLIRFFELHTLFLMIIPTSLIALAIIIRIPKDTLDTTGASLTIWKTSFLFASFRTFVYDIRTWGGALKRYAILTFIVGIVFTISEFILPIHIYDTSGKLANVALVAALVAAPFLFGIPLGKLVDRLRTKVISFALVGIGIFLFLLTLLHSLGAQLFLIFLISLCSALLWLSIQAETTRIGNPETYGTLSGAFSEIEQMAGISGPIMLGLLIDITSINTMFIVTAFIAFFLALVFRKST